MSPAQNVSGETLRSSTSMRDSESQRRCPSFRPSALVSRPVAPVRVANEVHDPGTRLGGNSPSKKARVGDITNSVRITIYTFCDTMV